MLATGVHAVDLYFSLAVNRVKYCSVCPFTLFTDDACYKGAAPTAVVACIWLMLEA